MRPHAEKVLTRKEGNNIIQHHTRTSIKVGRFKHGRKEKRTGGG